MTIKTPVVTALNSTTYTAIDIPSAANRAFLAFTEDGASFKIAVDASGTGEIIIPANSSFSDSEISDDSATIFYAKSISGTPNLAVIWG